VPTGCRDCRDAGSLRRHRGLRATRPAYASRLLERAPQILDQVPRLLQPHVEAHEALPARAKPRRVRVGHHEAGHTAPAEADAEQAERVDESCGPRGAPVRTPKPASRSLASSAVGPYALQGRSTGDPARQYARKTSAVEAVGVALRLLPVVHRVSEPVEHDRGAAMHGGRKRVESASGLRPLGDEARTPRLFTDRGSLRKRPTRQPSLARSQWLTLLDAALPPAAANQPAGSNS